MYSLFDFGLKRTSPALEPVGMDAPRSTVCTEAPVVPSRTNSTGDAIWQTPDAYTRFSAALMASPRTVQMSPGLTIGVARIFTLPVERSVTKMLALSVEYSLF